eukprot:TRINITY_DN25717_c0_g1_i1.p1 TRINITY_DN25717_c0_g1~~TRINITY_DN25717_c0_g1_i1.p1  ORF type:complete len:290 (-),score=46.80 TRINITY_DN25717_c0_g1_i1:8-877(-)
MSPGKDHETAQSEDEPAEPRQWIKALQICSAAVAEYGLRSCWRQAVELLQATREESIPPDSLLYNKALQACRQGNVWQQTMQMLRSLRQQVGLRADAVSYDIVLSAASAAASDPEDSGLRQGSVSRRGEMEAHWSRALCVLQSLAQDGTRADGVLLQRAMGACGRGQQWVPVLDLLEEMRRTAQEVTGATHGAAMAATARCEEDWPVVLRLFRDLRKRPRMALEAASLNAAFLATLLGGHPARAFRLLRAAKHLNIVEPDATSASRRLPVSPNRAKTVPQPASWAQLTV